MKVPHPGRTPEGVGLQRHARRIFVTGATGYVGGRLVPALAGAGYEVRCLAREPRKLEARAWRHLPTVSVIKGDLVDPTPLTAALAGCECAFYLVHSMETSGAAYAERDLELAGNFARAAAAAGVRRIIYLGGLGELGDDLSPHLRSRRDVEARLASSPVPVTTLRAAMIIGAGSASFEILRYLVERLPAMITPRWVDTQSQPVAIDDVLHWLVRAVECPETAGLTLEIGGPDVVTYRELMHIMADALGLRRRLIVAVPVLTPRLSAAWINLVTPVSYRIARPLAEGLRNRVVVTHNDVQRVMPYQPVSVRRALDQALHSEEIETRWSAAGPIPGDPDWAGGTVFRDDRDISIRATAAQVFAAVCRVGGGHGWYAGDLLWRLRGSLDTIIGGPGLRRGRRHPERVEFGEALDFWRVVGLERDRSLDLLAEMRLPGTAMLTFRIEPQPDGRQRLRMCAKFRPRGLAGALYWYAVLPFHHVVFGGMLQGIRRAAETTAAQTA